METAASNEHVGTMSLEQASVLSDGQREFMLDVRTQDLEVNMGRSTPRRTAS